MGQQRHRNHLRELRQRSGVSLRELSRRTGLDVAYLSRVERGQQVVSLDALRRIATVLEGER